MLLFSATVQLSDDVKVVVQVVGLGTWPAPADLERFQGRLSGKGRYLQKCFRQVLLIEDSKDP